MIAPLVEQMWRIGIDVSNSFSTHSWPGYAGCSMFNFRDREYKEKHPDLDLVAARTFNIGQRLLATLEQVEPTIRTRTKWTWRWDEAEWMSTLTLPQDDLPLLGHWLARVEKRVAETA